MLSVAPGSPSLVPSWWDYAVQMNGDADHGPAPGVVDVWFQTVADPGSPQVEDDLEMLSAEERGLHAGLREESRSEYRTAHALLRRVLSRYLPRGPKEWVFGSDDDGRPCLINPPDESIVDFNLSHTEGLVACAVTRSGRVGVDVEILEPERSLDRVVERVLGERERSWWMGLDSARQPSAFLELWTLKEARFKASAKGLRWPFSSVEFAIEPGDDVIRLDPSDESSPDEGWHYTSCAPTPLHRMAVAFWGKEKPLWRVSAFPT